MAQTYFCPAGVDCAFANSCPSFTSPCPTGFFCGSYGDSQYVSDLDTEYALWKTRLGRTEEINDVTKLKFIEPSRVVGVDCPAGYHCPNATTIFRCPAGTYCPEGMVHPLSCDSLSICPEGAKFQVNFVNIIIAGALTLLVVVLASFQNMRQAAAEKASRTGTGASGAAVVSPSRGSGKKEKEEDASTPSSSSSSTSSSSNGEEGLSFSFEGLTVTAASLAGRGPNPLAASPSPPQQQQQPQHTSPAILHEVTGAIPAGSFAAVMGPTGCGKSTLLAALRAGGRLNAGGNVSVRMVSRGGAGTPSSTSTSTTCTSRAVHPSELPRRVGFVPQDDILDRTLTVRELFLFNARARLPHLTLEQANANVAATLSDLGLQRVADTVIGGGPNAAANISGGQLKRVNIGCELVALERPGCLFCDEPTAGLDAAIANDLCATLHTLAREKGVTVVMVVQQPRPEIFERVSHLLLMQSGRVVYEGPSAGAAGHFERLGYMQPYDASDADFVIDVLNGLVDMSGKEVQRNPEEEEEDDEEGKQSERGQKKAGGETPQQHPDLAAEWDRVRAAARQKREMGASATAATLVRGVGEEGAGPTFSLANPLHVAREGGQDAKEASEQVVPAVPPGTLLHTLVARGREFLRLVALHAYRARTSRLRNVRTLVVYSSLHVLMAVALSSGFTIYLQRTYRNTLDTPVRGALVGHTPSVLAWFSRGSNQLDLAIQQLLFFMSTAIGSAAGLASVPLLGGQAALIARETSAGLSPAAYALGRMLSDTLLVLWNASIFAGVWLLFAHVGHWYAWLGVVLPTAYAASGVGYCASVLTRPVNASVITLVVLTAFSVFSGVEPTLKAVEDLPVVNWLWYISFATWTAEGTYVTWTEYIREADPGADTAGGQGQWWSRTVTAAEGYGYDISGQGRSIGALLGIGLAWRAVAILALWWRAHNGKGR